MLDVFEGERETAVKGDEEDHAAEDSRGGLHLADCRQLVDAFRPKRKKASKVTGESRGFSSTPMILRSSRTMARARASIPRAGWVGSGAEVYVTRAAPGQEKEIRPIAVAPRVSRENREDRS